MKTHVGAGLVLALVLWPGEAHLSRVHYREIALEQLVQWSQLIVVAKPHGARRTTEVPVGADAPPFTVVEHPFEVSEVLKGSLHPKEKEQLWVAGAELNSQFSLHKKYYVDRISKSPIYDSYEPKQAPGEGARLLFLRRTEFRGEPKVTYTVLRAEEHTAQRAAVEKFLKAKKR